ncbi:type II toxin-antitoxin system HipA family toxin [Azospirillum endophyticum]
MTGALRTIDPVELIHVEMEVGGTLRPVGDIARRNRTLYFAYDPAFRALGLDLSPFRLRPGLDLYEGPRDLFDGLHGVFNDSLPDGWGRLLLDRKLREGGFLPGSLTPLDRLAMVGSRGMGALRYRPEHPQRLAMTKPEIDLDELAESARLVLEDDADVVIDHLLALGGSSSGARPKALVGRSADGKRLVHGVDDLPPDFDHWIVKFRSREDPVDIGAIEQAYALMAREAGIDMPETTLFPSARGPGYFGIRRFDRDGNRRIHMLTACGLLHADHRIPSIGYDDLLKATRFLTRREADVDSLFARMVFNVLAHNRDDHTKNHSFVMAEDGAWSVAPAYDVTFSAGPGGYHALMVGGDVRDPGIAEIRGVAAAANVRASVVRDCIDRTRAALARWPAFAAASGVSRTMLGWIAATIGPGR